MCTVSQHDRMFIPETLGVLFEIDSFEYSDGWLKLVSFKTSQGWPITMHGQT